MNAPPVEPRRDGGCPRDAVPHELLIQGTLHWGASWSENGRAVESSGSGRPTPEIRELLYKAFGRWSVHVDSGGEKAHVMMTLRTLFQLTMQETAEACRVLPGKVFTGTRGEAQMLAEALAKVNVRTTLSVSHDL